MHLNLRDKSNLHFSQYEVNHTMLKNQMSRLKKIEKETTIAKPYEKYVIHRSD